jgi:hypothetical protein
LERGARYERRPLSGRPRAPRPHPGQLCGAPTRGGTPCRTDAAICGWHKAQRARAAHPSAYKPKPKPKRAVAWLAASGPGDGTFEYTSKRLRHLAGPGEWPEPPDGDGGNRCRSPAHEFALLSSQSPILCHSAGVNGHLRRAAVEARGPGVVDWPLLEHRPPQVVSDQDHLSIALCRSPASRPLRHRALATGRRRAARQSGDRPARTRKTHLQSCPPSRWPPETHRRTGSGTRASRPRRPSFGVGRRQAGIGRSLAQASGPCRLPQPQRPCSNAGGVLRMRECFGERSLWSARSAPRVDVE